MAKRTFNQPFADADVAAMHRGDGLGPLRKDKGTGACPGFYVRLTKSGGNSTVFNTRSMAGGHGRRWEPSRSGQAWGPSASTPGRSGSD